MITWGPEPGGPIPHSEGELGEGLGRHVVDGGVGEGVVEVLALVLLGETHHPGGGDVGEQQDSL